MEQHQDYDKILQETISRVAPSLVEKLCGIRATNWENVSRSMPRTIERRSDWLKIGTENGKRYLYHLEFQSANDLTMPLRMLIYYTLFRERYGLDARQFVIYLGEGVCSMPSFLKTDVLDFRFSVISINTIDYKIFVTSDAPEEIILAILANFGNRDKEEVVGEILQILESKTKNKLKLGKYLFQLEILSHLRKLQPIVTTKLENMSIHYDIKSDVRYQQGAQYGKAEGINLGKAEGINLGKAEGINLGKAEGLQITAKIIRLYTKGLDAMAIAEKLGTEMETVLFAIAEYEAAD